MKRVAFLLALAAVPASAQIAPLSFEAGKLLPITPGAWQCAEYSLTLNDPGSQNGSADFWMEGVHQGTFANIEWRTAPNLRISTFALDSYNHMNNGPIPAGSPNRVYYDNFVMSTEPVGCLD